jgi:M6 family metalloprotease-like protein
MSRRSHLVALAAAVGGIALAAPAQGLIVWEGKEVSAWPEEARPALPEGVALAATNIGLYPHPTGNVYGLTLLVDFSDATPAFTKADVDAWLNLKGYNQGGLNGSVRDYFLDESNGMVDFQNEIFGFYRAKQTKAHYEGSNGYSGSDELFGEIMDYFDPLVDFSKYDNDKDGRTDAISIVYAGAAETWGQGLWPHASGSNQKRDGVTVARYMMSNLGTSLGLYTFSHEVGHMLFGWPDLYGFGNYCIMGNGAGQKNPPGINDFYRADQGWIPLVDVTKDTNAAFTATRNGAGYRYTNPKNAKESFFWSNVQSTGRFSTIAGDGLLLLHFDKTIGSNNPPNPLSLAVVQADGKKELDQTMWPEPGSDAKDYFQAGGVSEFSGAKFATAKWNDGSASELRIYEVGAISENMPFKVGNGPIVIDPNGGTGGMSAGGTSGAAGSANAGAGAGTAGAAAGTAGVSTAGMGGALAGGGGASGGGPLGIAGVLVGAGAANIGGNPSAPEAGPTADDGSCACRFGASSRGASGASLGLALLAALVRRRRSPS